MIDPKILLDFIKERRSIRAFQDKPIPEEEIEMILEAGQWAPSASNRQPWEFIVIKSKDILKKIARVTGYGWFIGEASFAVANLLEPKVNELIFDMCAAPGIKTSNIAHLSHNKAKIIANDFSKPRVKSMSQILSNLDVLNANLINSDGIEFPLRSNKYFDKILFVWNLIKS